MSECNTFNYYIFVVKHFHSDSKVACRLSLPFVFVFVLFLALVTQIVKSIILNHHSRGKRSGKLESGHLRLLMDWLIASFLPGLHLVGTCCWTQRAIPAVTAPLLGTRESTR